MRKMTILLIAVALSTASASANAAIQALDNKNACLKAGGKVIENPYKVKGQKNYEYLCTYPDKLDRNCIRKNGVGWYYDVVERRCEPEDDCLVDGGC